ncbi:MAG: BTAD domain-containing putative transcriptional regulator [Gemmatimonadaceae bacterium]
MIRLQTVGALRLEIAGDEAAGVLAQPKRLALLVYLALGRPRGAHRRDTLLAMFWPELDEARARHALSQSLHFLRRSLGADAIVSRTEDVAINPALLTVDVLQLEDAIARGALEEALTIYEGDFLVGFHVSDAPEFERWADGERVRLRGAAVDAAHRCAEQAIQGGQGREAVAWAARAIDLDPTNERAIRRLMRARDATGDRAGALRDYMEFAARMREELDAEPSPETQQIAAAIRARSEASNGSGDFVKLRRPEDTRVAADEPSVSAAAPTAPRRRSLRSLAGAAAALVASVVIVSAGISYTGEENPVASMVVLPFADMGAAGTDAYIGDGLTEDLTTILSKVPGLVVTARTSAFAYKGKHVDVREIGNALDVTTALEGSVRREGDSLRITAQLIDAQTGYHIWSESYDRPIGDILKVQDEIARSIVRSLQLSAGANLMSPLGRTANVAAYDAYLRGRYLLTNRTRARTLAAIEQFQRAASLDSMYPRAFAGLADAYTQLAEFFPPRDILPMAKAAAERAVRLDSTRVEPRLARADLFLIYDRDWQRAEQEFHAALRLDPRSALAHERYARFLAAARRFDEHLEFTRKALAIRRAEPRGPIERQVREHAVLAAAFFAAQRFDEALEHGLAASKLDPGSGAVNAVLGRTYIELGRYDKAIDALDQAWPAMQQLPALSRLGYAYGRAGNHDDARRILAGLQARADTSYVPKDQIALVQLGLGDRDAAIASLWQAFEERHWWLPWINQSPPFDVLRSDPRYLRLLEELDAP